MCESRVSLLKGVAKCRLVVRRNACHLVAMWCTPLRYPMLLKVILLSEFLSSGWLCHESDNVLLLSVVHVVYRIYFHVVIHRVIHTLLWSTSCARTCTSDLHSQELEFTWMLFGPETSQFVHVRLA